MSHTSFGYCSQSRSRCWSVRRDLRSKWDSIDRTYYDFFLKKKNKNANRAKQNLPFLLSFLNFPCCNKKLSSKCPSKWDILRVLCNKICATTIEIWGERTEWPWSAHNPGCGESNHVFNIYQREIFISMYYKKPY